MREGHDLDHEMMEGGVIKIDNKTGSTTGSKAAPVYGQMNEPPGHPRTDSTVLPILMETLQLKKIEFDYGSIIKDLEVDSSPL